MKECSSAVPKAQRVTKTDVSGQELFKFISLPQTQHKKNHSEVFGIIFMFLLKEN